jgi:hypothetical protein
MHTLDIPEGEKSRALSDVWVRVRVYDSNHLNLTAQSSEGLNSKYTGFNDGEGRSDA